MACWSLAGKLRPGWVLSGQELLSPCCSVAGPCGVLYAVVTQGRPSRGITPSQESAQGHGTLKDQEHHSRLDSQDFVAPNAHLCHGVGERDVGHVQSPAHADSTEWWRGTHHSKLWIESQF